MKVKFPYPRIANAIYRQPWCIVPSVHQNIVRQFEAHIKGDMPAPDPDESEDEAESQPSITNTVGVIPIYGILGNKLSLLETLCGGVDCEDIAEQIKAFRDDPNISAIVLDFDSPGGGCNGIPELADLIASVDTVKPVYGFCGSLCASAAYWLASQCRSILVAPSSNVGSIGCYIYLEDHSRELDKAGITPNPIVSKESPLKLAGADFKPLTDQERSMFQDDVERIYSAFVGAIGRKRTVAAEYLNGDVFDGQEAVEFGLADGQANDLDEMISLVVPAGTNSF